MLYAIGGVALAAAALFSACRPKECRNYPLPSPLPACPPLPTPANGEDTFYSGVVTDAYLEWNLSEQVSSTYSYDDIEYGDSGGQIKYMSYYRAQLSTTVDTCPQQIAVYCKYGTTDDCHVVSSGIPVAISGTYEITDAPEGRPVDESAYSETGSGWVALLSSTLSYHSNQAPQFTGSSTMAAGASSTLWTSSNPDGASYTCYTSLTQYSNDKSLQVSISDERATFSGFANNYSMQCAPVSSNRCEDVISLFVKTYYSIQAIEDTPTY